MKTDKRFFIKSSAVMAALFFTCGAYAFVSKKREEQRKLAIQKLKKFSENKRAKIMAQLEGREYIEMCERCQILSEEGTTRIICDDPNHNYEIS